MLGLVDNLGIAGVLLDVLQIYVGILAATILFIATNAGRHRRLAYHVLDGVLPAAAGRLPQAPPAFKTPWLALVVFAGFVPDPRAAARAGGLPRHDVLVRRDALVHGRARVCHPAAAAGSAGKSCSSGRDRISASAGVDWPVFAFLGGIGDALAWLVVVVQDPPTRYAGLGWLAIGLVVYVVYRRRVSMRR